MPTERAKRIPFANRPQYTTDSHQRPATNPKELPMPKPLTTPAEADAYNDGVAIGRDSLAAELAERMLRLERLHRDMSTQGDGSDMLLMTGYADAYRHVAAILRDEYLSR